MLRSSSATIFFSRSAPRSNWWEWSCPAWAPAGIAAVCSAMDCGRGGRGRQSRGSAALGVSRWTSCRGGGGGTRDLRVGRRRNFRRRALRPAWSRAFLPPSARASPRLSARSSPRSFPPGFRSAGWAKARKHHLLGPGRNSICGIGRRGHQGRELDHDGRRGLVRLRPDSRHVTMAVAIPPCMRTTMARADRPAPQVGKVLGVMRSWRGHLLQAHQRDLQVSRRAQEVHDLDQFAVRHRLVRAQEDEGALVALCRRVERAAQESRWTATLPSASVRSGLTVRTAACPAAVAARRSMPAG